MGPDGFYAAANVDTDTGTISVAGFHTGGAGPSDNLHLLTIHWSAGIQTGASNIILGVDTMTDMSYNTINSNSGLL